MNPVHGPAAQSESSRPGPPGRKPPMKVLVVDDSALVREVMKTVLSREGGMDVVVAPDGLIAEQEIQARRPDVIVLDLEMPRMDGLTLLRRIMETDPIPVVICSGLGTKGSRAALEALAEGAVEVVAKPRVGVREFLQESATMLIDSVRAAAIARVRTKPRAVGGAPVPAPPRAGDHGPAPRRAATRLVAIAASTGGPQALETILTALPAGAPGIVIVQHMPAGFTAAFAERLNAACRLEVKEAASGDLVMDGRVLLAPGGRHLSLRRTPAGCEVLVEDGPLVSRHRPSANLLFHSVARSMGANALGIILSGIGDDGVDGLLEMRIAGAVTLAQSQASCAVFGMPGEAIARGAAEQTVELADIPAALLRWSAGAEQGGSRAA